MGFINLRKKLGQIWAVFQNSGKFYILDQLVNRCKNKKRVSPKVTQTYEEKLNRHTNMSRLFYPLFVRRFCFALFNFRTWVHWTPLTPPPPSHPRMLKKPSPQRVKRDQTFWVSNCWIKLIPLNYGWQKEGILKKLCLIFIKGITLVFLVL